MKIVGALALAASVSAFAGVDRALLQISNDIPDGAGPNGPVHPPVPEYCSECAGGKRETKDCLTAVGNFIGSDRAPPAARAYCKGLDSDGPSEVCEAFLHGLCHGASIHHGGNTGGDGGHIDPPHDEPPQGGESKCIKEALSHPFMKIASKLTEQCVEDMKFMDSRAYVKGLCAVADKMDEPVVQSYMQHHMLAPPGSTDWEPMLRPAKVLPKESEEFDQACAAAGGKACKMDIFFNHEVFPFTPDGITSSHNICAPKSCLNEADAKALLELASMAMQDGSHNQFIESGMVTCGNITLPLPH